MQLPEDGLAQLERYLFGFDVCFEVEDRVEDCRARLCLIQHNTGIITRATPKDGVKLRIRLANPEERCIQLPLLLMVVARRTYDVIDIIPQGWLYAQRSLQCEMERDTVVPGVHEQRADRF